MNINESEYGEARSNPASVTKHLLLHFCTFTIPMLNFVRERRKESNCTSCKFVQVKYDFDKEGKRRAAVGELT